jgi:hypothetical protein
MARFRVIWLATILAAGVLVGVTADAGTRGYIVNPTGLLLTLDADGDIVIGLREIPILAPEGTSATWPASATAARTSRALAVRVATGEDTTTMGRSLITPQGDRLLVLDTLPYGLSCGFLIDEGPTGRIFIHDVATGNKLGHVVFAVAGGDRLAAIHPHGDKAYLASDGPRSDQMTLTVVSLTTYAVVKELLLPKGDLVLSQIGR